MAAAGMLSPANAATHTADGVHHHIVHHPIVHHYRHHYYHHYAHGSRGGYAYNPGAAVAAGVIGGILGTAAAGAYGCGYGPYGYNYGGCTTTDGPDMAGTRLRLWPGRRDRRSWLLWRRRYHGGYRGGPRFAGGFGHPGFVGHMGGFHGGFGGHMGGFHGGGFHGGGFRR